MTIAAGIICEDGLVLCADSQFSSDTTKRPGAKLWAQTNGAFSFALTGAGTGYLLRSAKQAIERRLTAEMSAETVRQEIEKILIDIYDKVRDPDDGISLLIGVRSAEGVRLLEATDTDVAYVEESFSCFGSGSDLGNYLLDQLDPSTSIAWARLVAVRLLDQVKRYDLYCGSESQIVVIPLDVGVPHEFFEPDEVEQVEQVFDAVSKGTTPVLRGTLTPQLSDPDFDTIVDQFRALTRTQRVLGQAMDFLRRQGG